MRCNSCGHENPDNMSFCENCGNTLYSEPAEYSGSYIDELPSSSRVMGLISLICGIVSLVLCFCYGSGIAFAIAGLILGIIAKKKASEVGMENKRASTGQTLSIIGLVLNVLFNVVYFVVYFAGIMASSY